MTFWKFGLMTCIFNKKIHDNYSTQTYPDGIIHPPAVLTVDHRSTTKPTGRTLVLGRRLLPPNELETWLRDFDNAQQPGFPDVWFSLGVQKNLELRWVENPFFNCVFVHWVFQKLLSTKCVCQNLRWYFHECSFLRGKVFGTKVLGVVFWQPWQKVLVCRVWEGPIMFGEYAKPGLWRNGLILTCVLSCVVEACKHIFSL